MTRLASLLSIIVLLITACTAGSGNDVPRETPSDSSRRSIEMTDVSAERIEDTAALEWTPVDGAVGYRVGAGDTSTDVPASICQSTCAVDVPVLEPAGAQLTVSAVTADGAASEPAIVDVAPAGQRPTGTETADPTRLEVLLVYGGSPPTVETVPVSSEAEAQAVIADARQPGTGVVSATLNLPAAESQVEIAPDGPASGAWQAEALHYDQLPGDPLPGHGVVVAMLEKGGVDTGHPALAGAVDPGTHLDGSGSGTSEPTPHATFVASMMVGQPGQPVPGIAPGATVMPINVGDGRESDLIEGIVYAADHGADVVNISLALGCGSLGPIENCPDGLQAAADYAESKGVVVVAGAGNNGDGDEVCTDPANADLWPAVLDTVVSVGGHSPSGEVWLCSPDRPDVDLLAPAASLLGADAGGGYRIGHGTSYASPLVAGLIAVILAERPDLTPADIRALLPQWRRADGRLSVLAALVTVGIVGPDELEIDTENVASIHPYTVQLRFGADHPVSAALPQLIGSSTPWRSTVGWAGSIHGRRDENDYAPYGEIAGLIVVNEDGSVDASGVFTVTHGESYTTLGGEYGDLGPLRGHWKLCPSTSGNPPTLQVFRWDHPVAVDAALVPGSDDEVELTFSLGVGATAEQGGELGPVTYVYDNLDQCEAQLAPYIGKRQTPYDTIAPQNWGELAADWDQYFATMESINERLVQSSPITLAEPVSLRFTSTASEAVDDPRVRVVYTNGRPE